MPASKKPRKKYKRTIIYVEKKPLPVVYGLTPAQKKELSYPYHVSLDMLRRGVGNDDDAHLIFSALIVAKELAGLCEGSEPLEIILAGIDAITGVKDRGDVSGKWGMSGDQFSAIKDALVLKDELDAVTIRREQRDAMVSAWDALGVVKQSMKVAA